MVAGENKKAKSRERYAQMVNRISILINCDPPGKKNTQSLI